jgi:hypothetical protein
MIAFRAHSWPRMCYIPASRRMRSAFHSVGPRDTRPARTRAGRRGFLLWAAFVLLASPVLLAQATEGLRIVPLVRDDNVLVSFDLRDGYTDEVRAAIRSGLKTTFTYDVELRLDVPGWVDRTIGTSTVTSSVEFDNLTRRFEVIRAVDGRVTDESVTEDETSVRRWMTNLVRLPLFRTSLLEANRDYYVRIRATARPSNGSILWPFGSGTSAQAKFTFVR